MLSSSSVKCELITLEGSFEFSEEGKAKDKIVELVSKIKVQQVVKFSDLHGVLDVAIDFRNDNNISKDEFEKLFSPLTIPISWTGRGKDGKRSEAREQLLQEITLRPNIFPFGVLSFVRPTKKAMKNDVSPVFGSKAWIMSTIISALKIEGLTFLFADDSEDHVTYTERTVPQVQAFLTISYQELCDAFLPQPEYLDISPKTTIARIQKMSEMYPYDPEKTSTPEEFLRKFRDEVMTNVVEKESAKEQQYWEEYFERKSQSTLDM